MKKIAIVTNFNIYEKATAALKVTNYLLKFGCKILVSQYSKDRVLAMKNYRGNIYFLPIEKLYDEADLVIALGGDGTILEVARRAANRGTPILGINLGRLGYMAELEMSGLDGLDALFDGNYTLDHRSMLRVELFSGNDLKSFCYALNDAVISNGSVSRMIDLELSEGGVPITTYRADGLIVATPTGSTAYSMSASGSIVDPRGSCFCVTPICPHSLAARPMIFPDSAVLEIKNICQREKMLYLTVDGRTNYEMYKGDVVRISKSPLQTNLVRIKNCGFYKKLRQKMTENE